MTELIDYDAFCGAITDEAAAAVAGHTVGVKQLAEWLAARDSGSKDFLLVDVREKVERDINAIPGSVLIPKGDFQTGEALGDLPQDKQVVLYCKTGVRSAEVLAIVHWGRTGGRGPRRWRSQIGVSPDPSPTSAADVGDGSDRDHLYDPGGPCAPVLDHDIGWIDRFGPCRGRRDLGLHVRRQPCLRKKSGASFMLEWPTMENIVRRTLGGILMGLARRSFPVGTIRC